jgi:hypothetical protein
MATASRRLMAPNLARMVEVCLERVRAKNIPASTIATASGKDGPVIQDTVQEAVPGAEWANLIRARQDSSRSLGQVHEVGGVKTAGCRLICARRQVLDGELADRLEHGPSVVLICALAAQRQIPVQEAAQSAEDIKVTIRARDPSAASRIQPSTKTPRRWKNIMAQRTADAHSWSDADTRGRPLKWER